jgi:hypothetical protein
VDLVTKVSLRRITRKRNIDNSSYNYGKVVVLCNNSKQTKKLIYMNFPVNIIYIKLTIIYQVNITSSYLIRWNTNKVMPFLSDDIVYTLYGKRQ